MTRIQKLLRIALVCLVATAAAPAALNAQTIEDVDQAHDSSQAGQRMLQRLDALRLALYEASTNGDAAAIGELISESPDAFFYGTDPSEVIIGHDNIVAWWQGIFDLLASIGYPNNGGLPLAAGSDPLQVDRRGSVGWIADEPVFQFLGGDVPVRLTLVARREGGDWKIVQGHFSFGVPDADLPLF